MDINKNYYAILGVARDSSLSEIKKSYYKLSFTYHPDKGGDPNQFAEISEAYTTLSGDDRDNYDRKSRWGINYDESTEFLEFEFNNLSNGWSGDKFEEWKNKNQLNVVIYIDDKFDGHIEYNRWVICKGCGGDGKDTKSKIEIKDENGKVVKMFEGSDGCDFCYGTGKQDGYDCYFCGGKGKVGWTNCKKCDGKMRILGNQKLSGIKIPAGEKAFKIEAMGHASADERGKVGCIWLVNKD